MLWSEMSFWFCWRQLTSCTIHTVARAVLARPLSILGASMSLLFSVHSFVRWQSLVAGSVCLASLTERSRPAWCWRFPRFAYLLHHTLSLKGASYPLLAMRDSKLHTKNVTSKVEIVAWSCAGSRVCWRRELSPRTATSSPESIHLTAPHSAPLERKSLFTRLCRDCFSLYPIH
jgi:hypothetical protein